MGAWEEYRDTVQTFRGGRRKVKAQTEWICSSDVKNNKGILRYIDHTQNHIKRTVPSLTKEKAELTSKDIENAEGPSEIFLSVFTVSQASTPLLSMNL